MAERLELLKTKNRIYYIIGNQYQYREIKGKRKSKLKNIRALDIIQELKKKVISC